MLSTIVLCEDKPATCPGRDLAGVLARTLASLVTANVEGLRGDVRIAGPAGYKLGAVANHAGCALIEAENEADWFRLALQAARGPDVFLLCCGRAPEPGFIIEEAADFLAANTKDKSLSQKSRPCSEEPRSAVSKGESSALRGTSPVARFHCVRFADRSARNEPRASFRSSFETALRASSATVLSVKGDLLMEVKCCLHGWPRQGERFRAPA